MSGQLVYLAESEDAFESYYVFYEAQSVHQTREGAEAAVATFEHGGRVVELEVWP